jgi:hypothetical protein
VAIDWGLAAAITMPVAALFMGAALDRLLERRPKLITYYGHVSSHTLRGPAGETVLHAHSVVVSNAGRKAATNVRIGHSFLPDFTLYPSVQCTVQPMVSGGHEIVLPVMVPGEQITISYLYFPPVFWNQVNTYVKSDEGMATVITVLPARQPPAWLLRVLRFLVLAGIIATVYVVFVVIRALLRGAA